MVSSLIEQAKKVLSSPDPSDEQLSQAETGLSTYLEALATNRISDQVGVDELEEANRLLRELRRERSRRASGSIATPTQPLETSITKPVVHQTMTSNRSHQLLVMLL
jgi:hypothetical protein